MKFKCQNKYRFLWGWKAEDGWKESTVISHLMRGPVLLTAASGGFFVVLASVHHLTLGALSDQVSAHAGNIFKTMTWWRRRDWWVVWKIKNQMLLCFAFSQPWKTSWPKNKQCMQFNWNNIHWNETPAQHIGWKMIPYCMCCASEDLGMHALTLQQVT